MIWSTYKWGRVAQTTGPVAPRDTAPGAPDTIATRLVVPSSSEPFPRRLQGREES
jgi:hypothetical protein